MPTKRVWDPRKSTVEAVPNNLEPGDRVTMHYLMGMVTQITR